MGDPGDIRVESEASDAPYRESGPGARAQVDSARRTWNPFAPYLIVCDASERVVRRRLERAVEQRQWHAVQGRDKPFEGVLWQTRFEISPNLRLGFLAPVLAGRFTESADTVLEIQARPRGSALGIGMGLLLGAAFFAGVFLVARSWFALVDLVLIGMGALALAALLRQEVVAARRALERVVSPPERTTDQ